MADVNAYEDSDLYVPLPEPPANFSELGSDDWASDPGSGSSRSGSRGGSRSGTAGSMADGLNPEGLELEDEMEALGLSALWSGAMDSIRAWTPEGRRQREEVLQDLSVFLL